MREKSVLSKPLRQSPGDLGGFPGNPSVLENIGEASRKPHVKRCDTCFGQMN